MQSLDILKISETEEPTIDFKASEKLVEAREYGWQVIAAVDLGWDVQVTATEDDPMLLVGD